MSISNRHVQFYNSYPDLRKVSSETRIEQNFSRVGNEGGRNGFCIPSNREINRAIFHALLENTKQSPSMLGNEEEEDGFCMLHDAEIQEACIKAALEEERKRRTEHDEYCWVINDDATIEQRLTEQNTVRRIEEAISIILSARHESFLKLIGISFMKELQGNYQQIWKDLLNSIKNVYTSSIEITLKHIIDTLNQTATQNPSKAIKTILTGEARWILMAIIQKLALTGTVHATKRLSQEYLSKIDPLLFAYILAKAIETDLASPIPFTTTPCAPENLGLLGLQKSTSRKGISISLLIDKIKEQPHSTLNCIVYWHSSKAAASLIGWALNIIRNKDDDGRTKALPIGGALNIIGDENGNITIVYLKKGTEASDPLSPTNTAEDQPFFMKTFKKQELATQLHTLLSPYSEYHLCIIKPTSRTRSNSCP